MNRLHAQLAFIFQSVYGEHGDADAQSQPGHEVVATTHQQEQVKTVTNPETILKASPTAKLTH